MSIVKGLDEMWSRASFILGPDKLRAILPALEFKVLSDKLDGFAAIPIFGK